MNKHYFAAANTGIGFYNCFDYINDARREGVLYILKGGPGTGKSTLMKKFGGHFESLGEDVEYFHCSTDEKSLDGVRLNKANIAIVDGTAPHVTEAQMPGITDHIINLGEFIGPEVKEHKDNIRKLMFDKKEWFNTAYAYIRAAAGLNAANMLIQAAGTDIGNTKKAVDEIWENLNLKKINKGAGYERKLFVSAVSGTGRISYNNINKYSKVIGIKGSVYAARAALAGVAARLTREGRSYTSFCDLFDPDAREALQIDDADALISLNPDVCDININLDDTSRPEKHTRYDSFSYGDDAVNGILGLAAKALSEARAAHVEIEACYIPAMDFQSLDNTAEALIAAAAAYL